MVVKILGPGATCLGANLRVPAYYHVALDIWKLGMVIVFASQATTKIIQDHTQKVLKTQPDT